MSRPAPVLPFPPRSSTGQSVEPNPNEHGSRCSEGPEEAQCGIPTVREFHLARHRVQTETLSQWWAELEGDDDAVARLGGILRRARVGSMTSGLVREVHAVVQVLQLSAAGLVSRVEAAFGHDAVIRSELADITAVSEQLGTLLSALRRFVQVGVMDTEPVPVHDIIDDAIALSRHHLPVGCRVHSFGSLTPHVVANGALLTQAIVNLVENAAFASPPRGAVDVEVHERSDWVTISVIDDGPGVPKAIEPHLFEPFASSRHQGQSAGLGLALAANVLRAHGGSLTYERVPDRGAKFTATIPAATIRPCADTSSHVWHLGTKATTERPPAPPDAKRRTRVRATFDNLVRDTLATDISSRGLDLVLDFLPDVGQPVMLRMDGPRGPVDIAGHVASTAPGRVRVQFTEVNPGVALLLHEIAGHTPPPPTNGCYPADSSSRTR